MLGKKEENVFFYRVLIPFFFSFFYGKVVELSEK